MTGSIRLHSLFPQGWGEGKRAPFTTFRGMATNASIQQFERPLDVSVIAPKRGHIYQLRGHGYAGRTMRKYAETWAASTLLRGECVHWIDGASRMNPTRILRRFPRGEAAARDHLHRLYVGRGFTVHQLATLVERLEREVSITAAPLVIVDAPLAMHLDRQVGDHEARCLMRQLLQHLQSVAVLNHVAVLIITEHTPMSKRHKHLLMMVERKSSQQLIEHVRSQGRNARRWLSHEPSGSSGQWPQNQNVLRRYIRPKHQVVGPNDGSS